MPVGQYVRNRAVSDRNGDPYATSFYTTSAGLPSMPPARIGTFPIMTNVEIRLLRAEGYIITQPVRAGGADIDVSRAASGLPTLASMAIVN